MGWCEDMRLIDADAAINVVEFECGEWRGLARTIVKAIKQLPSAQPTIQPQTWKWIPVSERLPELRHNVLLTVYYHESWSTVEGYRQDGEFMFWHNGMLDSVLDEENRVAAWMPLPIAYKVTE